MSKLPNPAQPPTIKQTYGLAMVQFKLAHEIEQAAPTSRPVIYRLAMVAY